MEIRLVDDETLFAELLPGMVEVEKVVGAVAVTGDRLELSSGENDERVIYVEDDSMQLVEDTLAAVIGNNGVEDSAVLGPAGEAEVVFIEGDKVLVP